MNGLVSHHGDHVELNFSDDDELEVCAYCGCRFDASDPDDAFSSELCLDCGEGWQL